MNDLLKDVIEGRDIGAIGAESVMSDMIAGGVRAELVGAFLAGFYFRPPSGKALAGLVRAVRKSSLGFALDMGIPIDLTDVCGTGGDGHGTFNVSTCVAFVAASCQLPIAKHGSRAVSSRCGSFDVLEQLGIPFADTAAEALSSLKKYRLTFMYAPSFHPAFRQLSQLRRALGFRTVLNVLGPLLNPANVNHQLIGVYSQDLLIPVAEALGELGAKHAMVVCADDGSDEISLCSATKIAHLQNGRIIMERCAPEDFDLKVAKREELCGGSATKNAEIIESILRGKRGACSDMVALNTAAALLVGEKVNSLREGVLVAKNALTLKRAEALFNDMRTQTAHEVAQ